VTLKAGESPLSLSPKMTDPATQQETLSEVRKCMESESLKNFSEDSEMDLDTKMETKVEYRHAQIQKLV